MKPPADIFSVLRKFDPIENEVDKRVLYEITGTPISNDKYWDTSDEESGMDKCNDGSNTISEEDPNQFLMRDSGGL